MAAHSLAAMEVPIVGSDSVEWTKITVPSVPPSHSEFCGQAAENTASCFILGDPPTYIIWRIHQDNPNTLELIEFSPRKQFPTEGLHLIFEDSLLPFAFICKNEVAGKAENAYFLYVLTVSGVAYLLKLKKFDTYVSGSIYPRHEHEELHVHAYLPAGRITSVAATFGCLAVGREDGFISCFQLGTVDHSAPGFMYELCDNAGVGRIWSFMSRTKVVRAVKDLVVAEAHGRKLLMAIHIDGYLRVWDIFGCIKLISQNIRVPDSPEFDVSKLWVADAIVDLNVLHIAVSWRNLQTDEEMVTAYCLSCIFSDKLNISLEPLSHKIFVEGGRLVGLKLSPKGLWILKGSDPLSYDFFHYDVNKVLELHYGMLELFVARQLFQVPEFAPVDFLQTYNSMLLPMKNHIGSFISSAVLRKLLHPGVCQRAALLETFQNHSDVLSISIDVLKKEIYSMPVKEGIAENPLSLLYYWKNICTQYFQNWCQNNVPYSLFVDYSTEAVGLIRKNSVSLFRSLGDVEMLTCDFFDKSKSEFVNSELISRKIGLDHEILLMLLKCFWRINHQIGSYAPVLYYEALVNPGMISSGDFLRHFVKILAVGFSTLSSASPHEHCRADVNPLKQHEDNARQRKFSVMMLNSLLDLHWKASSWSRVLDILDGLVKCFLPDRCGQIVESEEYCNINSSLLVQATCQIAESLLQASFSILLFSAYLIDVSGQVSLDHNDISRLRHAIIPLVHSIQKQWLIAHFIAATPSDPVELDDFSSQLSSLHLDNRSNERWDRKLGKSGFTLACIFLLNFPATSEAQSCLSSSFCPNPVNFVCMLESFCSWIFWGDNVAEIFVFFRHIVDLAVILLLHHQYEAVENLLILIDAHGQGENVFRSIQSVDCFLSSLHHLRGFCLLMQAQRKLPAVIKEKKICEAVCSFFSAASVDGAYQALGRLPCQISMPHSRMISASSWRLYYYEWVMQIFEQYNLSEAASQFALAALEQVDDVLELQACDSNDDHPCLESASAIRGRLWANVFKFTLDLKYYRDAFCALISNPDEDSKHICLKRFLNIIFEHCAVKVLCGVEFPFVGLMDQAEQELIWKAERSDVTAKPNPYKLLYAFEIYRHNWQKAATYMYQYSVRVRNEATIKEQGQLCLMLEEQLHGLSASINALKIAHPNFAWVDAYSSSHDQQLPSKKARMVAEDDASTNDLNSKRVQCCVDIEKLEREYVLTSALHCLTLADNVPTMQGDKTDLSGLVDLLIEAEFYDMAFTVILKFWTGSALKRELEQAFVILSQKCYHMNCVSSALWSAGGVTTSLLTYGDEDDAVGISMRGSRPKIHSQWDILQSYLEKYRKLHPRLPLAVAETLLSADWQLELPRWLVLMFEEQGRQVSWTMTDHLPDVATLFRLYVSYGRHAEATNLFIKYLESLASLRAGDIINRKKMSAVWLPYTAAEQLWCQLEDLQCAGHMVETCDKLKRLLNEALLKHLEQVKVDSGDALAYSVQ